MNWPTPQDYNEAIQDPRIAFRNPTLRFGKVRTTPLGLPRPITGAFASVYQVDCPGKSWAVRCFLRHVPDQESRYEKISHCLRAFHLPCMVDFEFLKEGILVKGHWYPVLKMEWVNGDPLNTYVERHLGQPAVLQELTRQWLDVLALLKQRGIAHGDLQHGNIIVSNKQLKLIDYDGMFVPAMQGSLSNENGHRNYQHPLRNARDFESHIDNFAGWSILCSLQALTIDPQLWGRLNAGDECLLFRSEDYQRPGSSVAFKAVSEVDCYQVKLSLTRLRSAIRDAIKQIPTVCGSAVSPTIGKRAAQTVNPRPDWLNIEQSDLSLELESPDLVLREPELHSFPDWMDAAPTNLQLLPRVPANRSQSNRASKQVGKPNKQADRSFAECSAPFKWSYIPERVSLVATLVSLCATSFWLYQHIGTVGCFIVVAQTFVLIATILVLRYQARNFQATVAKSKQIDFVAFLLRVVNIGAE